MCVNSSALTEVRTPLCPSTISLLIHKLVRLNRVKDVRNIVVARRRKEMRRMSDEESQSGFCKLLNSRQETATSCLCRFDSFTPSDSHMRCCWQTVWPQHLSDWLVDAAVVFLQSSTRQSVETRRHKNTEKRSDVLKRVSPFSWLLHWSGWLQ